MPLKALGGIKRGISKKIISFISSLEASVCNSPADASFVFLDFFSVIFYF